MIPNNSLGQPLARKKSKKIKAQPAALYETALYFKPVHETGE